MSQISPTALVVRREHALSNDLSETETVMLDIERGAYFGLKDVGKVIWEELAVPVTVDGLCNKLMTRFEVERERCRVEVHSFLGQLQDEGLIEVRDAETSP